MSADDSAAASPAASPKPPQSLLAFDFGTKRVGVATGNRFSQSAEPLKTIALEGEPRFLAIAKLIKEWQPDALVIGVPDERFGEAVVAVVGLRSGELASGEDITGALQDLARYKRPRSFVFVDAIKRGPNGKADYGWAKDAARAELDTK